MAKRIPDPQHVIDRLFALKMLIGGMGGAMPTHAAELRREAQEGIDDLIRELRQ